MEPTTRVCVKCGGDAADHDYCPRCGEHLAALPELPTRAEWEHANPSAAPSPAPAAPPHSRLARGALEARAAPPPVPMQSTAGTPVGPTVPNPAPTSPTPTSAAATTAAPPAVGASPAAAARGPIPAAVWAGTVLVAVGALMMVLAIFLPIVSSYIHVGQNSLVEGANTKSRIIPFVAGALAIVSALVTAHTQRRRRPLTGVVLGGIVGLGAAIADGADHSLRMVTTVNVLGQEAGTIEAGLGAAMYVAGVGGVLAIVGAWIWAANAAEW